MSPVPWVQALTQLEAGPLARALGAGGAQWPQAPPAPGRRPSGMLSSWTERKGSAYSRQLDSVYASLQASGRVGGWSHAVTRQGQMGAMWCLAQLGREEAALLGGTVVLTQLFWLGTDVAPHELLCCRAA